MEPQLNQKDKNFTIIVKVSQPQLQQSGGFTTYLVSGQDSLGTFQIRRRYNDFFYLRQALKKKWPGLYIPPIPQKKLTGNKQSETVQMRRRFFDLFFVRLARKKHLFCCSVTQQFLRNKTLDMEKYFQTLGNPNSKQLSEQYKKIFASQLGNSSQAQLRNLTNNFYAYLKKAEKQIKNMRAQVAVVVEARKQFFQNLNKCNNTLLPAYEKQVYAQYVSEDKAQNGLLFVHNHKVQDNIRNLRDHTINTINPFEICLDMLTYQAREIEAMQQAIITRQNYETNKKKLQEKILSDKAQVAKLGGGQTTFKSLFSRGNKTQQKQALQKSIPELQKQIQGMNELCQVINSVLGSVQIQTFKKDKQIQYYEMMESVSEKEISYLAAYGQFMRSLMDGLSK